MVFRSLGDIESLIRSRWFEVSCDPVDLPWSPENPARGQCAVTALVVQDLLGGEILIAEVHHTDGTRQSVHYWNRISDGVEVDLTREQFTASEVILTPTRVVRPADLSGHGSPGSTVRSPTRSAACGRRRAAKPR
ncbi:MAG: hypothetical protein M3022_09835 [Actinomycetota bacterium]|nr:hypothetical protein [Actinomycetota bacterium]